MLNSCPKLVGTPGIWYSHHKGPKEIERQHKWSQKAIVNLEGRSPPLRVTVEALRRPREVFMFNILWARLMTLSMSLFSFPIIFHDVSIYSKWTFRDIAISQIFCSIFIEHGVPTVSRTVSIARVIGKSDHLKNWQNLFLARISLG